MKSLIAAACAVLLPAAALAHDAVAVEDAYARSSNPKAGAAFMVLDNHRQVDCTLIGVTSDAAAKAELHTHQQVEGVMKMTRIEGGILVPAGQQHVLERGGDHVMLMGLHQPLAEGDSLHLELDFGDCGTVAVDAPVDNARMPGQQPDGAHMGH